MDYCSSCRRHLNGALVCPGCGAYAPDIAPIPTHGHAVRAGTARATSPYAAAAPVAPRPFAPASSASTPFTAASLSGRFPGNGSERVPERVADRALDVALGLHAGSDSDAHADADADMDVDLTSETASPSEAAVSAAPQGRAARRRQLARWKKNQRRAVVVTAVTLVSGLAVAALERQNGDRTQAASAPETPTAAGGEEPTLEHTVPTVSRSDGRRDAPSAASPSQPAATGHTGRQDSASGARPDSASVADTAAQSARTSSGQQRGHGSSVYGSTVGALTGTAGQQPSAPAATGGSGASTSTSGSGTGAGSNPGSNSDSGSGSGSGSNSSSSSGASGSSPSSSSSGTGSGTASTSPSDVCLLGLICLG
ncbi:SCO2400 family protein [Streptomyces sp. NPDC002491]